MVTEATNPYPEGDRMMIAEAAEAKFGQLAGADLAPYREAVDILAEQIRALGIPVLMLESRQLADLTRDLRNRHRVNKEFGKAH